MKSLLAVLVVGALAFSGCNKSRSTAGDDASDTPEPDIVADAGDAEADAPSADIQPDGPIVAEVGLPDALPEDTSPADTSPEDTSPQDTSPGDTSPDDTSPQDTSPADTSPEDTSLDVAIDVGEPVDVPLVAYVVTVAGQQEIELVPIDASAPPRSLFRSEELADAAYPAFSPDGQRIAFMTVNDDNETRVAVIDVDGESPALFFDAISELRVLGVEWLTEDTLAVTALVDGPPGVNVVFVSADTGANSGSAFGTSGGQVLSVHTDPGFTGFLTLEKPAPPLGELWYDGFRGREADAATSGLPIVGDVSLNGPNEFFFVDDVPALHRASWTVDVLTTESTRITPEGIQEYHPRPVAGGDYYVSARFREGEPARPAPRDIILVDGFTGQRVWTITDTPVRYERHPDVQTHIEWAPEGQP